MVGRVLRDSSHTEGIPCFDYAQHRGVQRSQCIQRTFFLGILGLFGFFGFLSVSAAAPPPLPSPPERWTLSESGSLYGKLYHSVEKFPVLQQFPVAGIHETPPLDADGNGVIESGEEFDDRSGRWISDRIVTAVATDLVVQFYEKGTDPLFVSGADLIVRRSEDLIPIRPEELRELNLGFDKDGKKFDFREVKRFVRHALLEQPEIACKETRWWPPWWYSDHAPPEKGTLNLAEDEGSVPSEECIRLVSEVRDAIENERELLTLRQDLSLIAYGGENIWDGELTALGTDLRTYDLLLDVAAVGNVLGSAPFQLLFDHGNQGEQCDDPVRCPSCLLPAPALCGDGGVQGAEQCDDGNRTPGDGCDEFCQVEGDYCGNGKFGAATHESWEMCDEGKECPDGTPCGSYKDCFVSGALCKDADIKDCKDDWERVCRFSGIACTTDSQCPCPSWITNPRECTRWKRDSCRYVFDGVCKIGEILEGTRCRAQQNCAGISRCNTEGFCTNHPYWNCSRNEDCYSCTEEEVWGTCYEGGRCTGNEDCPKSGYCILAPANACRPRTTGGRFGFERSSCNEFCEDVPRCGDRVVYLDSSGVIEECDDGAQCADGMQCAIGQRCPDGSDCEPRSTSQASTPMYNPSCDENCKIQMCGDKRTNPPEECDTGATCVDGTACILTNPTACNGKGVCTYLDKDRNPVFCGTGHPSCPAPPPPSPANPSPGPNLCRPDDHCTPKSDDGDACNERCAAEFCGDGVIEENAKIPSGGEKCDNGGLCKNGSPCGSLHDCQTKFSYCEGSPDVACVSTFDCPRGKACLPANTSNICATRDLDGCKADCSKSEFCGDNIKQNGPLPSDLHEQCDPGSACVRGSNPGTDCSSDPTLCTGGGFCGRNQCVSGCSGQCKNVACGNGIIDPWGPDCDPNTKGDNEECDDGNTASDDGCSASCKVERCGDTVTDANGPDNIAGNKDDEECDPPVDPSTVALQCCGSGDCACTAAGEEAGSCTRCKDASGNGAACILPAGTCLSGCKKAPGSCPVSCADTCGSSSCGITTDCVGCCQSNVCGDGYLAGSEQCDDKNTSDGDGCSASCKREYCGDGVPQPLLGEQCDDGGICFNGNACKVGDANACPTVENICSPLGGGACKTDADCSVTPLCVGGFCKTASLLPCVSDSGCPSNKCRKVSAQCVPEACDPSSPKCRNDCQFNECGNGIKECSEECDDGNTNIGDGCTDVCKLEFCGDNVYDNYGPDNQPGRANFDDDGINGKDDAGEWLFPGTDDEECDLGVANNDTKPGGSAAGTLVCRTDCRKAKCGDGVVDTLLGEQCDQPTCPDGRACTSNAECGVFWCRSRSDRGCSGNCLFEGCGDGVIQPAYGENCDDGGKCLSGSSAGSACTIQAAGACAGGTCLPQSGDSCDSSCRVERAQCGDGTVDTDGSDNAPGNLGIDDDRDALVDNVTELGLGDDEQCEPGDLANGMCPKGLACSCPAGAPCTPDEAVCNLGTCNLVERKCTLSKSVCTSDSDCQKSCINTCTSSCKFRARLCGDEYRDPGEQCDDGKTCGDGKHCEIDGTCSDGSVCEVRDHDGCSFTCEIERPDLCGNGVVDEKVGEECDQGHPYNTVECTPFCRLPHPAPMCGDSRKDPSGPKRGDIVTPLLNQSEGYRLDWRIPAGEQIRTTEWGRSPGTPGAPAPQSPELASLAKGGVGWYVTPRLVVKRPTLETPFQTMHNRSAGTDPLDQQECSVCGDGRLQASEQCDSGRLSGGSTPNLRANMREWRRHVWGAGFVRYAMPYYWQWYGNLFSFGFRTYQSLTSLWYFSQWDQGQYINYIRNLYPNSWSWYYADAAWNTMKAVEEKVWKKELCSGSCTLQLCGDDTIEDGETCEDDNRLKYGKTVSGDGCSKDCIRESKFDFSANVCGDDVLEAGEECDDGGRCLDAKGKPIWDTYCRLKDVNPLRKFCPGPDGFFNTPDDNNNCAPQSGDGCSAACTLEPLNKCGNGQLEPYEECDNGGQCAGDPTVHCFSDTDCSAVGGSCVLVGGDGCDTSCMFEPPICGNGITEPWAGEACDAGAMCTSSCQQTGTTCGDGKVEGAEQCDDGAANSNAATAHNACRTNCVRPYCGDNVLDRGEECDDGNTVDKDGCTHCLKDLCGNGLLDAGETCDDGNRANGDGCSEWCLKENVCGNAQKEGTEQCDDGNNWSGDGCSTTCQFEYCGDGVAQPGMGEQCDRGSANGNTSDACRLTCKTPACGDAIKDTFEACDPGKHCKHNPSISCMDDEQCPIGPCDPATNECMGDRSRSCSHQCLLGECRVLDTGTCAANCTVKPKCGDTKVEGTEECDDGNALEGDGCNSFCTLEDPARCGNGRREAGEECDDGNRADHDGCTATCQLEDVQDRMICGGDCGNRAKRYVCSDGKECVPEKGCEIGACTLRPACVTRCVFGLCGNKKIDATEQCDDGRHCSFNPGKSCVTALDCDSGGCDGSNSKLGIPGRCAQDDLRACMTNEDCFSPCIPVSGDGCSADCMTELPVVKSGTGLILCQEEIGGLSGQAGQFAQRIGTGQVLSWQSTLLDPGWNPFLNPEQFSSPLWGHEVRYLGSRGGPWWTYAWQWWNASTLNAFAQNAWPWQWGSGWWGGWSSYWNSWQGYWSAWHAGCPPVMLFPNSIGQEVQAIAGCLGALSRLKTTPDRTAVMPFEPTGITSYGACQEPKAQLVSAVEIPSVPPISIPDYDPATLVADIERYLCAENGSPRRAFSFLCSEAGGANIGDTEQGRVTPSLPETFVSILDTTESQVQTARVWRELVLAHALDAGYRAGEGTLSQYLGEAFTVLSAEVETAVRLLRALQRIQFPDTVCPLGSTSLCPP